MQESILKRFDGERVEVKVKVKGKVEVEVEEEFSIRNFTYLKGFTLTENKTPALFSLTFPAPTPLNGILI